MVLMPLPALVVRELAEAGASSRTYLLRLVYAVVLYGGVLLAFGEDLLGRPGEDRGNGRELFTFVIGTGFVAVYLLLPFRLSTVLHRERRNGSLDLLLLAGLGERDILRQFLLSGLLPVVTWLLLALPLLAIAYARGGVESSWLPLAVLFLLASSLQAGWLALQASSKAGEAGRALLIAYLRILVGLGLVLPLVCALAFGLVGGLFTLVGLPEAYVLAWGASPWMLWGLLVDGRLPWYWLLIGLLPALLSARLFAGWAETGLRSWRRRGLPRDEDDHLARHWRRQADRRQGREAGETRIPLIVHPIAWRERSRLISSLGSRAIALVFAIGIPLILIMIQPGLRLYRGDDWLSSGIILAFWSAYVVALLITVVDAYASERDGGTWPLLLVSPLGGRSLIVQKLAVVRRLALWFGAVLAFAWMVQGLREGATALWWLLQSVFFCTLTAFLALLATLVALRFPSRLRALLVSFGALGTCCAVPVLAAIAIGGDEAGMVRLISPLQLLLELEYGDWKDATRPDRSLPMLVVCAWFLVVTIAWGLVLLRAERLLGRR